MWNIWFYTFIYNYEISKSVSKCSGNVYLTQDSLREWKCWVQKRKKSQTQLREHGQPFFLIMSWLRIPPLLLERRADCVVCSGCLIKTILAGWLKQQKFLFSQLIRKFGKSKIKVPVDSVANEGSLASLQMGHLLTIKYIHARNVLQYVWRDKEKEEGREGERSKLVV